MVLYNASAVQPTAELSALLTDFVPDQPPCLVVNKLTKLELFKLNEDGDKVQSILTIPVFSTIAAVNAVKLPGEQSSTLLVLTTSLDFFALRWQQGSPHYECVSSVSMVEPFGRLAEYQTIAVDPQLRCIAVYAYSGLLRVFPLISVPRSAKKSRGSLAALDRNLDLSKGYNIRLPSLNITSIECLNDTTSTSPLLSTVYLDHKSRPALATHLVDLKDRELEPGPLVDVLLEDAGSETAITVNDEEGSCSGVLVIGEESVSFYSLTSVAADEKGKGKAEDGAAPRCSIPVGNVTAWTHFPDDPNRILLGDLFGKLMLLELSKNASGKVTSLSTRDLGDAASPTSLVFLNPTTVYLASRFSDSQMIRLSVSSQDGMQVDEPELSLLSTEPSLAPIVDFCVVPGDAGASASVVTCSGAYKGGSLRVVRQGVGVNDLASIELSGVQRMWHLRGEGFDGSSLLALSFINSSQILSFASEEVEEIDLPGFATDEATLLAGFMGSVMLQVTAKGVHGIGKSAGLEWRPASSRKVTLAAALRDKIVVAIDGGELVVLDSSLTQQQTTTLPQEIASLHAITIGDKALASVGLWTTQSVHLIDIATLTTIASATLPSTYLIRSIALVPFSSGAQLFAGLGDGTLVSHVFDGSALVEASRKVVTVGTRPVSLRVLESASHGVSLFVTSDRPTIVTRPSDKLTYASVNFKDVVAVAPFDAAPLYEGCIAFASPDTLRIGKIQDIQRVDIRAVGLDEDEPRRIAHDSATKSFGVVCLRRDIDRKSGEQSTFGSFKIFDDQTFEVLASFDLQLGEQGQSISTISGSDGSARFVVGTSYVDPAKTQVEKGRLVVFRENDGRWSQESSVEIGGAPYSMSLVSDDHLVVAINSKVEVFRLEESGSFKSVAQWAGNFISVAVEASSDNTIIAADALRSVSVLHFIKAPVPRLVELSRDFNPYYMTAVARLNTPAEVTEETASLTTSAEYIGADSDLNFFTLLQENTTNERSVADEYSLTLRGAFHVGQLVCKFVRGSLVPKFGDASTSMVPKLVYATSAGGVGVLTELDEATSKLVSAVERNLRSYYESLSGDSKAGKKLLTSIMKQDDWRAFKSDRRTRPAAGFLDGDFIESGLEQLSNEELDKCLNGQIEIERIEGKDREEALRLVEELSRLH